MNHQAKLIIVMGVSGCGKSSVAVALSKHFNYEFVEADDFHSEENKRWMESGKALSDSMREPWIALLQAHLKQSAKAGRSCVMSFSGLRRKHRARMRDLPFCIQFIHLVGEQALIAERMSKRAAHFMPESLLDSQYAALEDASKEADVTSVSIDNTLDVVIAHSINAIAMNSPLP